MRRPGTWDCASPYVITDDEERQARIYGASVLYGITRKTVHALTDRGPCRPVILPTVSFYEQKVPGVPELISAAKSDAPKKASSRRKLKAAEPVPAKV
jgi:hypothetical protein